MRAIVFSLALLLSGCSMLGGAALDAVNPLKSDKGITATAQVGKENHNNNSKNLVSADVKTENTFKANSIDKVDLSTNIPWWVALMVAFMRPMVILREIKDLFWRSNESKPTQNN